MIVELFGLSGSGKSTIARELEREGRVVRVRIETRYELLWRSLVFIALHPVAMAIQLGYLIRYSGGLQSMYTTYMNLFLHNAAKYHKAAHIKGTALIDQGFLQNTLSLFTKAQGKQSLEAYMRALPMPDIVLAVVIDDALRKERLIQRGNILRKGETPEARAVREQVAIRNFATVREVLDHMTSPVVYVVSKWADVPKEAL